MAYKHTPADNCFRLLSLLSSYKQSLAAAIEGRQRVLAAGIPFSRPADYFAEMVKSDEHMERVRQRLLDERAGIQASEEARKQRELKKFGKKVQVAKLQEREKAKKDMNEKVKALKRSEYSSTYEKLAATRKHFLEFGLLWSFPPSDIKGRY